jgi:hypothetical protein
MATRTLRELSRILAGLSGKEHHHCLVQNSQSKDGEKRFVCEKSEQIILVSPTPMAENSRN